MIHPGHTTGGTLEDEPVRAGGAAPPRPGVVLIFSAAPVIRSWPLGESPLVIGREAPASAVLGDGRASREHAAVSFVDGRFRVRDLGSRNGTFVDGRQETDVTVGAGAVVRIGHSVLLLLADAGGFLDAAAPVARVDGMIAGPRLRDVLERTARSAATGTPLLLTGESGTGKELVARHYHAASPRPGGPFVAVNSGAIPEAIAERLFFGAVKGSYSGASSDAPGYLQEADGGTLFLDELGELPASVQTKLLRVLERSEVTPVGGTRPRMLSFGLVAATNADVPAEISAGRFRADLYYRIGRTRLALPPLRARREEIPWLVADELRAVDAALVPHVRLIEACCLAPWPGNVRQLRSELRAAGVEAVARAASTVTEDHLSATALRPVAAPVVSPIAAPAAGGAPAPAPGSERSTPSAEPRPAEDVSRGAILAALAAAGGNVTSAARALGVHRNRLYRLMDQLGIDPRAADAADAADAPDAPEGDDP